MPRRTKEEAEQTRNALMDAALRLFTEKGYTATTLADITRRAGVTKGAFYWHFKSKADLFLALTETMECPLNEAFDNAFYAPGTPSQRLERSHRDVMKAFEADERVRAIFELLFLKVEHTPESEPIMEREREALDEHMEKLQPVIEEAIAIGEFRSDLDPLLVNRAIMANILGLVRHWLANPTRFSLVENAEEFTRMLFLGFKA